MEAVFHPENFRIFSGDFRPVPSGKHRKVIRMHRKKSGNFPAKILLPFSGDFRCIPAGTVPYSLTWEEKGFIFETFLLSRFIENKHLLRLESVFFFWKQILRDFYIKFNDSDAYAIHF